MSTLRAVALIMITALVGCATTGGAIGNLVPAPKFLKGRVDNSIYQAMDGTFEARTPFHQESDAFKYMRVKEQYADGSAYVSFESSYRPNEIYRINIAKKPEELQLSIPFDHVVSNVLANITNQLKGYGSEANEQWRTATMLDGKKAAFITLAQAIPKRATLQGTVGGFTAFHILYVVEGSNGVGVIWVQWPYPCDKCARGAEIEIVSMDARMRRFFESFRLKV